MSKNEKNIFQKKMSVKYHFIKEVTGEKLLTVEDVIHLFGEILHNVGVNSSVVECNYCGEEVRQERDLQKHKAKLHPAQLVGVITTENKKHCDI